MGREKKKTHLSLLEKNTEPDGVIIILDEILCFNPFLSAGHERIIVTQQTSDLACVLVCEALARGP